MGYCALSRRCVKRNFADLAYTVTGINHLTWFTGVWLNGVDVMPRLHNIAAQRLARVTEALEDAKTGKAPIPHCNSPFESSFDFPFSWQCVQWFDAFPAPQDRHITEFFPQLFRTGAYYGKQLGVDEFSFEGTIASGDHIYAQKRAVAILTAKARTAWISGDWQKLVSAPSLLPLTS